MASLRRALPRSRLSEASENDPDGLPDPGALPPPRSPLVCIPDPAQSPRKGPVVELDVPKVDHSQVWTKGAGGTPRSAQSTPTKALSRVQCGNGGLGSGNGGRLPLHGGGRERGSSSRAVRATADVKSCLSTEPEVRHFELDEDPSFWNDHNVQVLIRIRPINCAESALQGHGRCLRQESTQTLTWTGHPETRFTFDHIACETISQAKLFKAVGVPMVENCMSGYNSCMFAYGQTGSGKTHTMMGEIREMDTNPCEDRGMTPRIFEYLFSRIREEEENRKNENLKYSCKCSYLEIYNEQITDLLDPSSTNLQLREDVKKGVYVENLKEHDVNTVKDVIELLLQGTANRKMAATSMNSESSRSHSVFTCSIESQWEKDSMRHIRFGMLNLVDLAGSERQKSSGAEGERLKEAANINRSLSTLGLVIMTLVDIANGKHRHVPYRDSRLTFLLQDSLGGNSKTTIIANVSPSICSANETLSALKFAQRAKLIQNNAKVNEDASGDVTALQREIQRLKDQLNIVTKHQSVPVPLYSPPLIYEMANVGNILDNSGSLAVDPPTSLECSSFLEHQMTFLKSALASSLRREKMAEAQVRSLEAQNEHMKQLVLQMEADVQRTKMMLHLRDETIRRFELQADGLSSGNEYLMEKNNTLTEEIQLLQEKIDDNPELTQFALENIKLLEQLRVFQDFYQEGEREILLNEISQLRNELLHVLEGKYEEAKLTYGREIQVGAALHEDATPCIQERNQHTRELIDCNDQCIGSLQINDCFTREIDDVHCPLKLQPPSHQSIDQRVIYYLKGESQMMSEAGPLPVELTLVDNVLGDNIASLVTLDEVTSQQEADEVSEYGGTKKSSLHATLEKAQGEFESARNMDMQFQNEQYSQLSQFYETERIREQVEVETAQTILNLQQELAVLQQEFCSTHASDLMDETPSMILRTENEELKERLFQVTNNNAQLLDLITAKDAQINVMADEWENAVIDLTSFLLDGCQSLEDASDHIHSIIESFPQSKSWIGDHVERAMKIFIEKERLIVNLQKSLEDAQKMGLEMTSKLNSLKGATLAITEIQQTEHEETNSQLLYLQMLLNEKMSMIQELENSIKCKDDQIVKVEKQANAAFIAIKRLTEMTFDGPLHTRSDKLMIKRTEIDHPQLPLNQSKDCQPERSELCAPPGNDWKEQIEAKVPESKLSSSMEQHRTIISEEAKLKEDVTLLKEIQVHIEAAVRQVLESENELIACCRDTQSYLASLVFDTNDMYSSAKSFLQQTIAEICYMKKCFIEVMKREVYFLSIVEPSVSEVQCTKPKGPCLVMQYIENDLTKANEKLRSLKAEIERLFVICRYIVKHEIFPKKGSTHMLSGEDMLNESDILHLRDGLKFSFDSLATTHDQLTVLLDVIGGSKNSVVGKYSSETVEIGTNDLSLKAFSQPETQVICQMFQGLEQRIMESDANCNRTREMLQLKLNDGRRVANEKTKQAANLFLKFEEAQETMKEADLILNELVRANETARLETDRWKHASKVMQVERASLAAEVEQMRNAIVVDEEQNQILKAQVNATIIEMPKLLSELGEMFQIMQNHTKSELKAIHSDILLFVSEMRECIRVSKAWSQTCLSEIRWEKIPSSVLQQHHVVHEVKSFNLGANPVRSWDVDSSSALRDTENRFLHIRNGLRLSGEDIEGENGLHAECELSDLGGSQEVLNTFQKSLADIDSNADSGSFAKSSALCAPNDALLQVAKLEKENTDLINDMNLVKGEIFNNIILLDPFIGFIKKQCLQHASSGCTDSHFGNECTTVNTLVDQSQECDTSILSGSSNSAMCMHPKLQQDIIHESVAKNDNAPRQDNAEGATIDEHILLNSIQQLRAQCAKVMVDMEKKKRSQLTFLGNQNVMLMSSVTKDDTSTEHGNQLMQAVDELWKSLGWLNRWLCAELDVKIEMNVLPSLFEMLFQGICNLEEKTCKFIERQSRNLIEQNGNLASSLSPKRELDQKDVLFRGVHCEQVPMESISIDKDIKREGEEITDALSNVQDELAIEVTQVDKILQHQRELDSQLAESEAELSSLRSELKDTKDALAMFVKENNKLVLLLEDVSVQKMDAGEQLKDHEKVIENLEREILHLNASIEERIFSSVEEIVEELRLVNNEKDQLRKEFILLNEKLDMASALADENEAIAIEARQVAEASKVYAEQKEEEVKVLESSVEELEGTINVLEKKVYDMGEEVERYRLIREDLEQELQALRERVCTGGPARENFEIQDTVAGVQQIPRQIDDILMELSVSKKRIKDLEKERACQAEEIKRYKEHISEIVLHSEAQSSIYQEKFQALEGMVYEVKTCPLVSNHASSETNKVDKNSMRQRGSGSPFRCISSLVQQMNSEKDQELSVAKHRIEELEVLASDRQKQVCMLSARLAAVDNMTHDVIRDLLEVKLDMTNYANLIDLKELHKLVQNGWQENDQSTTKDEEILRLRVQINALIEEKDSWIEERKAEILATQEKLEKLQHRDQLLTAQNEMLKLDKVNLTRKLTDLDEMIKKLVGSQSIQELIQPCNVKESNVVRHNKELARRLAESDKLLQHAKNELAWSSTCDRREPFYQNQ